MKSWKDYEETTWSATPQGKFEIIVMCYLYDLKETIEKLENRITKLEKENKICSHHKHNETYGGICSCCDLCPIKLNPI